MERKEGNWIFGGTEFWWIGCQVMIFCTTHWNIIFVFSIPETSFMNKNSFMAQNLGLNILWVRKKDSKLIKNGGEELITERWMTLLIKVENENVNVTTDKVNEKGNKNKNTPSMRRKNRWFSFGLKMLIYFRIVLFLIFSYFLLNSFKYNYFFLCVNKLRIKTHASRSNR